MEFKEGNQWKCCFDPQKGLYTAQIGFGVNCTLYEITKEIYENVDESGISGGSINDHCFGSNPVSKRNRRERWIELYRGA
ncbi:MAG: hypothetical protein J5522_01625 [Lachnospiraceae bacterium]|nr:hypothetical protein [Lachnospiraceae bacterium]